MKRLLAFVLLLPCLAFGQMAGGIMASQEQGTAAISGGTITGSSISASTLGANNVHVTEDNITARAGGGQASATALSATATFHAVTTVTTAADSIALPACVDGREDFVFNAGANAMQVFGVSPDTINGVATATGISQPAGVGIWYLCDTATKWRATLGANATGTGNAVLATSPTITSPALTAPTISGRTWATVNATTPTAGTLDYVTNIGPGIHVSYVGSRWKPLNGNATVGWANAASGITNTETVACQALMPTASVATGDVIRFWLSGMSKSGTTDTYSVQIRVGTAGTTSDTSVFSQNSALSTALQAGGALYAVKLTDATHVQNESATGLGAVATSNASAFSGSTVVTSAAANALYWSITVKSGATNTVGFDTCAVEWATP